MISTCFSISFVIRSLSLILIILYHVLYLLSSTFLI
nr:MAG TPA: hypothetical protein [Caudoviricetes sp.]